MLDQRGQLLATDSDIELWSPERYRQDMGAS